MGADGKIHEPIWPKIADFMLRHKLNPVQCIWYAFERRNVGQPPMPNQIAVEQHVHRYRSLNKRVHEEIVSSFESEKERFVVCLSMTSSVYGDGPQSCSYALLDDSHGCSPLFRYCLAVSEGLDNIAKRYEQSAILQYLSAPRVYNETWDEWIPESLKEQFSCL